MQKNTEPAYIQYIHAKAARVGKACSGTFEITARCNFNCRMCYIHSCDINATGKSDELSAEEWARIAREAAAEGLLFLLITGGEPLVREDFEEIYRRTRELGLLVSVNTNGSLINDALIAMFEKYPPRRLNISLYGCGEKTYGDLCGTESFERVCENLDKLKKAGLTVKLNMPATTVNARDTDGIIKISEKYGFPLQTAGYVFPSGDRGKSDEIRLSPEQSAAFDIERIKYYNKTEALLREYSENALLTYTPTVNCDGEENSPCRAGKSAFWITWDGKMLPCGMLKAPFADVKTQGFSAAWEKIKEETGKITLPSVCTGCKYRGVCGVCAAKCVCETGSFTEAPRYLCETARTKYDFFRKYAGGGQHEAE